jgi:GT2 family glycosyltransferase
MLSIKDVGSDGIDVIVVNYRTPEDLSEFVQSYREHPPVVDSTLWVCNVDTRDADFKLGHALVSQAPQPAFHVPFVENVGYARAVNRAARLSNREVLAIFNADVVLTKGALQRCYDAIKSHRDWGVLGPLQVNEQGKVTSTGIFGSQSQPRWRGWQVNCRDEWRDVRDDAVTVSGSAYFVRREVWNYLTACEIYNSVHPEAEGAFLPTPHYYEETWCSYHAIEHGWKVVYYGEVEIVHKWHKASPVGGWAEQQQKKSQKIFRQMCDYHGIEHD